MAVGRHRLICGGNPAEEALFPDETNDSLDSPPDPAARRC